MLNPVSPSESKYLKRLFVCSAVPMPENWRIVHKRPRYMVACTPRVNGYSPGKPKSRVKFMIARFSGV